MSSPTIERLRGQNDVWRQISKQLKETEKMDEAELNLLKNADTIANFERAVEEARHYILMDTDTFAVRAGDIVIRRENEQ